MSAELHVPDAALNALSLCVENEDEHRETCVRAIATPVVIHELLRIAGRAEIIAGKPDVNPSVAMIMSEMARALHGAVDELEAGAP